MWYVANFRRLRDAQAFVDYLKSINVDGEVKVEEGQVKLYIRDEMQLTRTQEELERFGREPFHERYRLASWTQQQADANPQLTDMYKGFSIWQSINSTGWFTKVILAICTAIYIYTAQGMSDAARQPMMFFASVDDMLSMHQIWRWITPALLHFGLFHFLFNMGAWWIFGGMVEKSQSSSRLFLLFLVPGVISNWMQFMVGGNQFGGLSGVVYAVLGYLCVYQVSHPSPPFRIPSGMMTVMVVALALGFLNIVPTANLAHLAGLVSGCVLGFVLALMDRGAAGQKQ